MFSALAQEEASPSPPRRTVPRRAVTLSAACFCCLTLGLDRTVVFPRAAVG